LSKVINFAFTDLSSIPIEIRSLLPHEFYRKEACNAIKVAIEEVWTQITKISTNNDDSEAVDDDQDLDSDDASFEWRTFKRSKCYPFEKEEIRDFFSSLVENIVFDMGFRAKGIKPDDERNCWCPWYVDVF